MLPSPQPVTVLARELQARYWMESDPASFHPIPRRWNEFAPWETRTVLDRDGIDVHKLSVAVFLGPIRCSKCSLAPAWVYTVRPAGPPVRYTLRLRPGAPMNVEYHWYRISGGRELEIEQKPLGFQFGNPFDIPLDVSAQPDGDMRVVVSGQPQAANAPAPMLEISFAHNRTVS